MAPISGGAKVRQNQGIIIFGVVETGGLVQKAALALLPGGRA